MFFIILCCYKPDLGYLRAQLDSLARQTDGDFQCLVQDDASPPELGEQIAAACSLIGDGRFHYRRNPARLGVFHNFERGLYQTPAEASYLCYCDQDDLWQPHKLARQRAVLSDPTVSLCHTDLEVMDESGNTLHPSCFEFENREVTDYSLPQLILRNSVTGCTLAFRATLLPRLLPFPHQGPAPRFHHDHWTALCATQVGRIVPLFEPLVRYRQHGGNVLGAGAVQRRWPAELGHLRQLLRVPCLHLAGCEPEWTRRAEFIAELLQRAPRSGEPESPDLAQLQALRDWTQRSSGSAYLLRYVLPHLFRPSDPLAEVAFPVVLGKLYNVARRAGASLAQRARRPLQRAQAILDRFDPPPPSVDGSGHGGLP